MFLSFPQKETALVLNLLSFLVLELGSGVKARPTNGSDFRVQTHLLPALNKYCVKRKD